MGNTLVAQNPPQIAPDPPVLQSWALHEMREELDKANRLESSIVEKYSKAQIWRPEVDPASKSSSAYLERSIQFSKAVNTYPERAGAVKMTRLESSCPQISVRAPAGLPVERQRQIEMYRYRFGKHLLAARET